MTQQAKMRTLFVSVIVLLCLCSATTYVSFLCFGRGERWITHTQEVRGTLGDLEATLNRAARARISFLLSGSQNDLSEYQNASSQIMDGVNSLHVLTEDNPV